MLALFPKRGACSRLLGHTLRRGLRCTIAQSLNRRWLSSSCVCRELGKQQWPSGLAPAPRELASVSRRRSTSNKHTKRCTKQSGRGSSKPEGGTRSQPGETRRQPGETRRRCRQCRLLQRRAGAAGPDLGQDVPGGRDGKDPQPAAGRMARASRAVGRSVGLF